MSKRAHGALRRGQVISTYGPGALIDLPQHSAIIGGLEHWPPPGELDEIEEPRLVRKLRAITGVAALRLYSPPADTAAPGQSSPGIHAMRFPEWFVVQEKPGGGDEPERSRRLVHRKHLDAKRRFDGCNVVATRFVRACGRGHVDDIDWWDFVHRGPAACRRQLWLDERGTSGDLADLVVRCECGQSRGLHEASAIENRPLGTCSGARPWLGASARETCGQPSRLLIRTASNAYFPRIESALSLPEQAPAIDAAVEALWGELEYVTGTGDLAFVRRKPQAQALLAPFTDAEVLAAVAKRKEGADSAGGAEPPVKLAELDAILAAPEGYGDDVPVDHDFHARRLPDHTWRRSERLSGIEAVIQLHRLREIRALVGFSRFEAVTPDIYGEYDTDVEHAAIAIEPTWFPAVENRGEGIFVQLRAAAVEAWLARPAVEARLARLVGGHVRWQEERKSDRDFPGGPYVLLHTLSHLLIQSLAMRCGYPASSIRERIYVDPPAGRYGVLLFTASPDADGTLGGLVQQARHVEDHVRQALRMAALCSNDPICAQHEAGRSLEKRFLLGAACHGCALMAETSCEMRNDYLDRALVVPIVGLADAAYFGSGA